MNPADLTPGVHVRVSTGRTVADHSWLGATGVVWGEFRRDEVPDWCLVRIDNDGTVIIGFAPDELDAAE